MESMKTAIIAILAVATAVLAYACYQQDATIWILKEDVKRLKDD